MNEKNYSYLHIIPFDLGYAFMDMLSLDNSKNFQMTDTFLTSLEEYCCEKHYEIKKTLELRRDDKKIYAVKCLDEIVENSICRVSITQNLYVFILLSGIGCFVFLDDGTLYEQKAGINWENDIFKINYIKRKSQKAILTGSVDGVESTHFSNERALMKDFMTKCWDLLRNISKKQKIRCVREYSSCLGYKNSGLSYVLTIYLMKKECFSSKEINYLLYAPFVDEVSITKEKAQKLIQEFEIDKEYSCASNQSKCTFSWAAVSAEIMKLPECIEETLSNIELSRLIKHEVYVQSRWFLADNSLDNAMKSFNNKLIGLQRLDGILEHYQAELNNEISANMTTEEKQMLKHIVMTSGIHSLYSSAKQQIKIQVKLKEEQEQNKKKRNAFLLSIFMAVFTACSLYSEVNDILTGANKNIGLLISMLIIAIGAVVIDYINK